MTNQTKFGRYQVAESFSALARLHHYSGATALKAVEHMPPLGVLDQEDLKAQGIDVSTFIAGATKNIDALGSCTANATTVALSNALSQAEFLHTTRAGSYNDTVGAERWAITFYASCTHQTGDTSTEWPPTDCGSSGPYIVSELEALGLASGDRIAHGADNIVSLMQTDGVLVGSPWFESWMEPDAHGFIDGDGSASALETAIRSGVAGGHETYHWGIEHLALTATGAVDPFNTIMLARNSWSSSWGDAGNFRYHLSTLVMLGQYCDIRQLVV